MAVVADEVGDGRHRGGAESQHGVPVDTERSAPLHTTHLTACTHTHARAHTFNGPLSGTTQVSWYQKGKTIWILLKQETVSGSGIRWAICVCTSLQTDNHASTPPLSFLQTGCPSCHPTNSLKALKAKPHSLQPATYSGTTRDVLDNNILEAKDKDSAF